MLGLGSSLTGGIALLAAPSYSMSFDGTNDRITLASSVVLPIDDTVDAMSVSFWAKRTDNSSVAVVIGLEAQGAFSKIEFDSDGDRLTIESDENGQTAYCTVTADTNWNHYVITSQGRDGGNSAVVIIYENGSAVSTTDGNFGVTNDKDLTMDTIGGDGDSVSGSAKEFKGLLYQIAFWDVVLDADAVAAIYNSGTPIPLQEDLGNYDNSGDLTNLWRFDESTGPTTIDNIGGVVGTLQANAAFSSTTP